MQIIVNVGDATPQDWEALAAFVAVKRGLLTTTGRVDIPPVEVTSDAAKAISISPEAVAAALQTVAVTGAALTTGIDAAVAAANEKAAADHAAFLARTTGAAVAAGAEVDGTGLPWDARIHAGSKAKNADGSWRAKPKVDPAVVTAVTAELRALMAAAPPAAPPVPLPPPPPPVVDPAVAFGTAAPLSVPVPPPPPPPVPVPTAPVAGSEAPALPPAGGAETVAELPFVAFMKRTTAAQAAGTLPNERITQVLGHLGLLSITDLAKRPDLIPSFEALAAA